MFHDLDRGETLLHVFRRTAWKSFLFSGSSAIVLIALVIVVVVGILGSEGWGLIIAAIGAAIVVGITTVVDMLFFRYGALLRITSKRILLDTGILSRRRREVRHVDVRSIEFRQTFLQRVLQCGRLFVSSAGHASVEIRARGFDDPEQLAAIVRRLRDETQRD